MILIKVNEGVIVKFPYSLDDLRAENPTKSFPPEPSADILERFSVYQVFYHPYPTFDPRIQTVVVATAPVLIEGVWTMTRAVVSKTVAEIEEYDHAELDALRESTYSKIDEKTAECITFGCIYLGRQVRLTAEDQNNFEGEYSMIKEYISDGVPEAYIFPTAFKVWTDVQGLPEFLNFTNVGQMKSFIYSGKIHIKNCLISGWNLKNTLKDATIDELRAWVDPR